MVLEAGADLPTPPGVAARPVASVDELVTARRIQHEAFGGHADVVEFDAGGGRLRSGGRDRLDLPRRSSTAEPVAAGYASYTPLGLLLFGGATLPSARGRGAYRALVAARAREAVEARDACPRHARRSHVAADPRATWVHRRCPDRPVARRLLDARGTSARSPHRRVGSPRAGRRRVRPRGSRSSRPHRGAREASPPPPRHFRRGRAGASPG